MCCTCSHSSLPHKHTRTYTHIHLPVQLLVNVREQLNQQEPGISKTASAKKAGKASDSASVRRQERAIRLSIEGLYKLFEGLQAIMASQSYMEVGGWELHGGAV